MVRKKMNPYSATGNQRFREVLTELDAKRKKILLKLGGGGWVVRFRESASNHAWAPVIFKEQPDDISRIEKKKKKKMTVVDNNSDGETKPESKGAGLESRISEKTAGEKVVGGRKTSVVDDNSFGRPYRPYCLWWLVLVSMIIFCLVIKGRSLAIFCTSVWWYLVPIVRRRGSDRRIGGGNGQGNTRFVGVKEDPWMRRKYT